MLQGTVRTYETRCGGLCNCVCCKFRGVCFCQELDKFDDIWLSYDKYKKGDVFWDTVYILDSFSCSVCNLMNFRFSVTSDTHPWERCFSISIIQKTFRTLICFCFLSCAYSVIVATVPYPSSLCRITKVPHWRSLNLSFCLTESLSGFYLRVWFRNPATLYMSPSSSIWPYLSSYLVRSERE